MRTAKAKPNLIGPEPLLEYGTGVGAIVDSIQEERFRLRQIRRWSISSQERDAEVVSCSVVSSGREEMGVEGAETGVYGGEKRERRVVSGNRRIAVRRESIAVVFTRE